MKRLAAFATATAMLSGCTALPQLTPDQQAQVVTQITQGQTVLTCSSIACAANFGGHSQDLQTLYATQSWQGLGVMIAQLNYTTDLAYFYLGLAAEGIGADQAALHYYQAAVDGATGAAPLTRCGSGTNICNGFSLPSDIYPHMQAVQADIARREAPPPPPKPRHVYHKPKASDWQTPTPDSP